MDIRAINAAHASMSRATITMTESEWQAMTPAAQAEIHDIVTRIDDKADNEIEQLMTANIKMRAALGSIIIRCVEGDKKSNWLPVIENIARNALSE